MQYCKKIRTANSMLVYSLMALLSSTCVFSSNSHLLYKHNTAFHNQPHGTVKWPLLDRIRREMQPVEQTTPDWDPAPSSQPPDSDYYTGTQHGSNSATSLDHSRFTHYKPEQVFTQADGNTGSSVHTNPADSVAGIWDHQSYELPQMAAQTSQQMAAPTEIHQSETSQQVAAAAAAAAAVSPDIYQSETRSNKDTSKRSHRTESGPTRELIITDKGEQLQHQSATVPYNPLYMTRPGEMPPVALPMSGDSRDTGYVLRDNQSPELPRSGETPPVALPMSGENSDTIDGQPIALAQKQRPRNQRQPPRHRKQPPANKPPFRGTQRKQGGPVKQRNPSPPSKPVSSSGGRDPGQKATPPPASRDRGPKAPQHQEPQPVTTNTPVTQRPPAANWNSSNHRDPSNRPPPAWGRRPHTRPVPHNRQGNDWSVQGVGPADRAPYRPMAGPSPSLGGPGPFLGGPGPFPGRPGPVLGPGVGPPPGWAPEDHIDTQIDRQMDLMDHRRDYYNNLRYNPQYGPPRPLNPDGHRFPAQQTFDSGLPAGTPPAQDRYPYRDMKHAGPLYPQYPPYRLGDDEGINRPQYSLDIQTGGLRPCTNTSDPRCSLPSPMMELDIESPYGEMDLEPGELDLEGPIAYQLLRTLGMGSPDMNQHAQEININHNVLNALHARFGINTTAGIRRMAANRQFQTFMHRVLTHSAPTAMGEYNANLTKAEVDKLLVNLNGSTAGQRMPTGNLDDAKLSVQLTNKTGTNMTAKSAKLSSGVLTIDGQPKPANIWNPEASALSGVMSSLLQAQGTPGQSALPRVTSPLLQAQGTQFGKPGIVQALIQDILGVDPRIQQQEGRDGTTAGEQEVKEVKEVKEGTGQGTQAGAAVDVIGAREIQKKSENTNTTNKNIVNIHGTSLPHRNIVATATGKVPGAHTVDDHRNTTKLQNSKQQPNKDLPAGTISANNNATVKGIPNPNKSNASFKEGNANVKNSIKTAGIGNQHQDPGINGKHASKGDSQKQLQSNVTNSAGVNQKILNTNNGKLAHGNMQGRQGQGQSHGNNGTRHNQNQQTLPNEPIPGNNNGRGKVPNNGGGGKFHGNKGAGNTQNQQNQNKLLTKQKQSPGKTNGVGKVPNTGGMGGAQGHGLTANTQGHGLTANNKPVETSLIHSGIIPTNATVPTVIAVPAYKSTTAFAIAAVTLIAVAIIFGPIICCLCQMNGRRREQLRKEKAMKNREMSENNIMEAMVLQEFGPKGGNSVANTGIEGATSADYYSIDEAVKPSENFYQAESERYTTLDDDLAERQKLTHGTDYPRGFLP